MKKFLNPTFSVIALSLWLILSGWGLVGHRKINQHAPASFPGGLNFLRSSWTTILADSASVADNRKQWDDNEPPRHYINIDKYDEFMHYGKIPMSMDSVKNIYGLSFVLDNGILPWATITAFDSVRACFFRNDFSKASLFAADLGHYIADGHMPLHITRYYEGKTTSQNGIHGRYESQMIGRYDENIIYADDTAHFITDVPGFIFTYLYHNYGYVDSVLLADDYAQSVAGGHTSTAYYQALWQRTRIFTTALFKHASWTLSNLIYTAWVEAGSPNMVPFHKTDPVSLGQNEPNPVTKKASILYETNGDNAQVSLRIYDSNGKLISTLLDGKVKKGKHQVVFDAADCPSGIYFYSLRSGDVMLTRKMLVVKE